MPAARPVVLVTGTSSGIGREVVLHLRRAGAFVVATTRDPAAIRDLAAPGEVECLKLDVSLEADRREAVAEVLFRFGRVDALVNNAGYGATLAVEDTPTEAMRAMFEVNLFALHDLTLRVLPAMRAQGSGRIVNVSSIAGHVSVPMMGAYCASKFAVRALTQALHNEVRRFGVHACLVEPGVIRTRFGERSQKEARLALPDPEASAYVPLYRQWAQIRSAHGGASRRGADPAVVAQRIVHACLSHSPRFHYFAPWSAKAANVAKCLLPDAALNAGFRLYFRGQGPWPSSAPASLAPSEEGPPEAGRR